MTIELGTTSINKLMLGSTEIKKAQLGLTTVYDKTGGGGGGGVTTMQDIVPEVWVDLDATKIDSYSGSGQTWANLVSTPFGGGTQTDFDAWLGLTSSASSDDPTFTGAAGDSGAYFAMDGADVFALKSQTAGVLNSDLHDGTTDCWFAIAFESASTLYNHGLFGNAATGTGRPGVSCLYQPSSPRILGSQSPTGGVTETLSNTGVPNTQQNWVMIIQYDKTNGNYIVYHNGTKSVATEAYSTTATTSPSTSFLIGARNIGTTSDSVNTVIPSGAKIRGFSAGLSLLTDTEAADILAEYNSRHGNIYS